MGLLSVSLGAEAERTTVVVGGETAVIMDIIVRAVQMTVVVRAGTAEAVEHLLP